MEDIKENEIIATEAIENLTDDVTDVAKTDNTASFAKGLTVGMLYMAGGVLLTKHVVIPLAQKIKDKLAERRAAKKNCSKKKVKEINVVDLDDLDLGENPEIEE